MTVNLLADLQVTDSGVAPTSWAAVPACSVTSQTVQGTDSVLLLVGTVTLDNQSDRSAEFRFSVNGSPTGSPVQTAFVDSGTEGESHAMTLVWAVDGLSGSSNSFAFEWQRFQAIPQIDTTKVHSFQVIEIAGGDAEIIVDQTASDEVAAPGTEASLMSQSSVTVAGTGSVLLFLGTIPFSNLADNGAAMRFAVDGTGEGARTFGGSDSATAGDQWSWCGIHAKTGVSSGTHSFELLWQDVLGTATPATDTRLRSFQVVEITAGVEILSEQPEITASWDIGASFGNDSTLDVDEVIAGTDSFVMVIANAQINQASGDQAADFSIGIDDSNVGGIAQDFSDDLDQGGSICLMHVETGLSAASHSFQLRGVEIQSTTTIDNAENRSMFVLEFITAAGDSFTRSVADTVGVTDIITVALDIVVVEAEPVGVTDDLSLVGQFFRTEVDSVVVTDTIAPSISFIRNFVDSVGITDTITATGAFFRNLADSVGITDAISTLVILTRSLADSIDVTDTVTIAISYVKLLSETIDITDTVSSVLTYIKTLADSVGVTDTLALVGTYIKTFVDTIDITDSINTAVSIFISLADTTNITDAISSLVILTRSIADTVGITDIISTAVGKVAVLTDTVNITDTVSIIGNYIREIVNTVNIADIFSTVGIFSRTIAESVIITDIRTHVGTFVISLQNTVTITDIIASFKLVIVSLSNTVGITDTISTTVSLAIFIVSVIELQVKHSRNLQRMIKRGKKIIRELRS
jgi:hypothetical protein